MEEFDELAHLDGSISDWLHSPTSDASSSSPDFIKLHPMRSPPPPRLRLIRLNVCRRENEIAEASKKPKVSRSSGRWKSSQEFKRVICNI